MAYLIHERYSCKARSQYVPWMNAMPIHFSFLHTIRQDRGMREAPLAKLGRSGMPTGPAIPVPLFLTDYELCSLFRRRRPRQSIQASGRPAERNSVLRYGMR
jgi:hypothetical protein